MATRYGKTFTTRRGRRGRYKYVNGRRVSFQPSKSKWRSARDTVKRFHSKRYQNRKKHFTEKFPWNRRY